MHTHLSRTRRQGKARRNKTQKGGKVVVTIRTEKVHPKENKPKKYYTVDKGRKVYEVIDDSFGTRYLDVYKLIMDKKGKYTRGERVLHLKRPKHMAMGYNKLLNKLNEQPDKERGTCLLCYVGNDKYVFIGHEIYSFTPNDSMMWTDFVAPLTEEGSCYPYVITDNKTYFLRDHVTVTNRVFGFSWFERKTPYDFFYGKEAGWIRKKVLDASKKPFDVKMIDSGLE
jgi:hypothetical protein